MNKGKEKEDYHLPESNYLFGNNTNSLFTNEDVKLKKGSPKIFHGQESGELFGDDDSEVLFKSTDSDDIFNETRSNNRSRRANVGTQARSQTAQTSIQTERPGVPGVPGVREVIPVTYSTGRVIATPTIKRPSELLHSERDNLSIINMNPAIGRTRTTSMPRRDLRQAEIQTQTRQTKQMGLSARPQTAQMGLSARPQTVQMGLNARPQTGQRGMEARPQTAQMGMEARPQTVQMGLSARPQTGQRGMEARPQTAQMGLQTQNQQKPAMVSMGTMMVQQPEQAKPQPSIMESLGSLFGFNQPKEEEFVFYGYERDPEPFKRELRKQSVTYLRRLAKENGLKRYSTADKKELVKMLAAFYAGRQEMNFKDRNCLGKKELKSDYTLQELRKAASKLKLKAYSKLSKNDLCQVLHYYDNVHSKATEEARKYLDNIYKKKNHI